MNARDIHAHTVNDNKWSQTKIYTQSFSPKACVLARVQVLYDYKQDTF